MESQSIAPGLEQENLWMTFRPGSLVYSNPKNVERIMPLRSIIRCECTLPHCWQNKWTISIRYIDYNGTDFGVTDDAGFFIRHYDGYRPLHKLCVFPLEYHPEKQRVKARLADRGRKFVGLTGIHYRWYDGRVDSLLTERIQGIDGEEDYFPLQKLAVSKTATRFEEPVLIKIKTKVVWLSTARSSRRDSLATPWTFLT